MTNKKENQLIYELYNSDITPPFTRLFIFDTDEQSVEDAVPFYASTLEQGLRQFNIAPKLVIKDKSVYAKEAEIDFVEASPGPQSGDIEQLRGQHNAVVELVNQVLLSLDTPNVKVSDDQPDPEDTYMFQTVFDFKSEYGSIQFVINT